ncbi:arylsulfatase [Pyxidicoccus parkwayensis]|uniref:Arylsulfatase n=1 Tax=Pyxidicoccus parkwayensis TaxID=2813578 RepID=A0ABX7P4L1_9BACT|nr:arylsulfatase [Pyxidicoccus parkwaysis]QSQ25376.1 arylsulfatase [Pyxidicoccus parkwaysis]
MKKNGRRRAGDAAATSPNETLPREVLPIPDRLYQGVRPFSARDPSAKFPPIVPLRPPGGAPNILVILLDDVGFGASSAFGGVINTPTAERLASGGLRYNRFHTTALCSPTRAALLTGRNHHAVGFGGITEIATSSPGYTCMRPNHCAPVAEVLKLNGYSTAQFGKCHEVPVWETSPVGPFDRWPTGSGFEYFFGFVGGETNQYYPALYENTTPVEPDRTPEQGYHFMEDMTDRAIDWVRQQKALTPDKPFFCYFAPGATHAPHHVPKAWADKYKGRFDGGWDKLREDIFARQKKLGVIPKDAVLTPRPKEIPAWNEMPEKLRPVLARQMEVYAGFLEYADTHVGRLIDAVAKQDILEDTLVYYIIGDNGASAEGTLNGTFNEGLIFNEVMGVETPDFLIQRMDKFGTPEAYNHYAVGWAHAMDTPYQWTKQVASHYGGTRNGCIVHWPRGIQAKGEVRSQFTHVIDVAPTILEAAGLPQPMLVHGVQQTPMQGVSMDYSFDDAKAPERHQTQYFEMFGNRGIYHQGWTAVTRHRTPWEPQPLRSLEDDVWELYDTTKDWTQARDVAAELPDKLRELKQLFLIEAAKYYVLPLDDRGAERFNAEIAGRPELIQGDSQVLSGSMRRLSENSMLNIKNKSHSVTAEVEIPDGGANGVIVTQGGAFGGWCLFVRGGRLQYCYNYGGLSRSYVEADRVIPAGTHQVRMEFKYDGGGVGKGGDVTLYVDGKKVGRGRVEQTLAYTLSLDETADVGMELGSPVAEGFHNGDSRFTGRVKWVQLDKGREDFDHFLSPQERFRQAMARQ